MNKLAYYVSGVKKQKSIYCMAWAVLIVSVLVSVFARAPFGFYDEHIHYIRALGVGDGQLLSYPNDKNDSNLGHAIDEKSKDFTHVYVGTGTDPVSVGWLFDENGGVERSDKDVYVVNTSAAPYTPLPYLPYAFGAKVAQVFNLNLRGEFVSMRLAGVVMLLSIVFAAFRISPRKFKWVVLTVSLIPMSIAAFGAISTDGFTIAASLLFMATIARLVGKIQSKKLTNKDILKLGLVSVLVVSAKMPLFLITVMILAVIAVYWTKLRDRQKVYLLVVFLISFVITVLWANYAKDINTGAFWGRNVDTAEQLQYILHNPLVFARNLLFSMLSYDYTNVSYFLYANATVYRSMPFVVDIAIIIGLVLSPFVLSVAKKPTKEQIKIYWIQVMGFVGIVACIFVLLYLQFTPVGTPNNIEGVQPRYLIPLLPLLLMSPYALKLSRRWRVFAYTAPFIGVVTYLGFLAVQVLPL